MPTFALPDPSPALLLDLEMMLRIMLAFALGAVLGWERDRAGRPAGLRTHMMVAAGSAAFTLVSIYGFPEPAGGLPRDPARVAAQIVSGVGFLGAGTIFRTPSTVRGLTTAASVWLAAAIGMMAGVGMYAVASVTALLGYICLRWLRTPSRRPGAGEPSIAADQREM